MKAVVCAQQELRVEDVPDPVPGPGQLVLDVTRCGICGSDLHARVHSDVVADLAERTGYDSFMRSDQEVVLGHEFVGAVADYGPRSRRRWSTGTSVVSLPLVRKGRAVHLTGLSAEAPGGYAERVLVQEAMTMPVPNGLAPEVAALTEPMAVALHAVRRGQVARKQTAVVIGCGPIGLAVICMLKASGVRTVVASDPSEPRRRLAERCGADVVVDPTQQAPWSAYSARGELRGVAQLMDLGVSSVERLQAVPRLPWWRVVRAAQRLGAGPTGPVVFECVGVPGIIDSLVMEAPLMSRVVVVGVCMEPDRFTPAMAINKELELRFVFGYDPTEFREALHLLAEGKVDGTPLVTGTVGLSGVEAAFAALGSAETHAKVLIDPASTVATV